MYETYDILCTTASRDQIELMERDKAGIAVAEFRTVLHSKDEFERKIKDISDEAKERLERRKTIPESNIRKQVDYFIEKSTDEEDE